MLRLLIKDITVEQRLEPDKQAVLHIRWQGGVCSDVAVPLPPRHPARVRCPEVIVTRIRELARRLSDAQIAWQLNQDGYTSVLGKPFSDSMIKWIRWRHRIPTPKKLGEFSRSAESNTRR